ncbi:hypothetical protein GOBAR_AA18642 [Gossypium barbadense]|uniref:Uncharacterized protein n=1 Tax=Gossypium barbadense TaxID=3634 RepID=A0A2P5XFD5_GOSBA|nr:hypothetical protein GOBAR_AA18642 [Gossypium barbadense]
MQLLGVVGSMKGMTSSTVASECVLKMVEGGEISLINASEPQQLAPFAAYFVSNLDLYQACNFANFAATGQQVKSGWFRNIKKQRKVRLKIKIFFFYFRYPSSEVHLLPIAFFGPADQHLVLSFTRHTSGLQQAVAPASSSYDTFEGFGLWGDFEGFERFQIFIRDFKLEKLRFLFFLSWECE